ncbi:hypothetical protein N7520_009474 [Penicillium odoratum]|uniref:uncharacterized protein n=1 Tax=Penicillium odoratum TaxID=1167516 RepID=UPI0025484D51|nr:uncharacterized protein N7520_009474 [Penicillium odoratum]KAJ5752557.1 hypothetical protein N7520_009474 [Penicillium odoratum]
MVSFQCEGCGDVLTKKKLDPHRGQCRGATFTCIDCMVHFYGTDYRAHTSCMTEDQKYQGALYKEKPAKNKKGQNNPNNQNAKPNQRNQQARVEDAPPTADAMADNGKAVNVFDYLVTDETPNASKASLVPPKEQMTMVAEARSLFEPSTALANPDAKTDDEGNYDIAYEENGFSYGADPIPLSIYPNNGPNLSTEFVTPAPKKKKDRRKEEKRESGSVSEKKRKRGRENSLSPQQDIDTPMMDVPSSVVNNAGTPMLNHSGLTGGLNRMMRSPSHEMDDTPAHSNRAYKDASSPIKRSRRSTKEVNGSGDAGLGISIKNRAGRLVSSMFGGTGSVVSASSGGHENGSREAIRRGSASSGEMQLEVRKKKSHRSRNESDNHDESRKSKRKSSNPTDGDRPPRRLKQADESPRRESRQVTVYQHSKPPARADDVMQREMASHFLSLVSRDSERGCSINKALKRFHRDFSAEYDDDRGRDNGRSGADRERRSEDEKDLWRALRLRRNDRGEIVVFV